MPRLVTSSPAVRAAGIPGALGALLGFILLLPAPFGHASPWDGESLFEFEDGPDRAAGAGGAHGVEGATKSSRLAQSLSPQNPSGPLDLLVVYTPAAEAMRTSPRSSAENSPASIPARVRQWVAEMNEALAQSTESAAYSVRLAGIERIDYDGDLPGGDFYPGESSAVLLRRLANPGDGHMDEVPELRSKHAADVVALVYGGGLPGGRGCPSGFVVSHAWLAAGTLMHEIGHCMDLSHDRYQFLRALGLEEFSGSAYGYTNQAGLLPGASIADRWYTLMAYPTQCDDANVKCRQLLRISNPHQRLGGHPLGVPASSTSKGRDGPADNVSMLLKRWPAAVDVRQRCQPGDFSLSRTAFRLANEKGAHSLELDASEACVWEVQSRSDWISVLSGRYGNGAGKVEFSVAGRGPLGLLSVRRGSLSVAGHVVAVTQQRVADGGVCARTGAVRDAIAAQLGLEPADCGKLGGKLGFKRLGGVERLDLGGKELSSLKAGDFDGLENMTRLDLSGNELSSLPAGVFGQLASLEALDLGGNELSSLPAGVFGQLASLEALDLGGNELSSLPAGVFGQLASLEVLDLGGNQLSSLPAGVFGQLANLKLLYLNGNELSSLPAGVFGQLASLEVLDLGGNQLSSLPAGVFGQLANLETLVLASNHLTSLPAGMFGQLANLKLLFLSDNRLSSLPAGVFGQLANLKLLYLGDNRLSSLPLGVFGQLGKLSFLDLGNNQLTSLPFFALGELAHLVLEGNRLSSLVFPTFLGMPKLSSASFNDNPGAPFQLPVVLQHGRTGLLNAAMPHGAPRSVSVPVALVNGTFMSGKSTAVLTVPAGAVVSETLAVAREGAGAVTAEIGALNPLRVTFRGMEIVAGQGLVELEVIRLADEPAVSVSDAAGVSEGAGRGSAGKLRFAIRLSKASLQAVKVPYSLGGTATAGADYARPDPMSAVVPAGKEGVDILLPVFDDQVDEPDETVSLVLGEPWGATVAPGRGRAGGVIIDDDATPALSLSLSPPSVGEGGESRVKAALSAASSEPVTLTVSAEPVAPAVAGDFSLGGNRTLTIAAGSTASSGTVTISAAENEVDAADRRVTVSAGVEGGNGIAAPASASLVIVDNDVRGVSLSAPGGVPLVSLSLRESDDVSTEDVAEHRTSYTVALESEPTGAVTIHVESGDSSIAEVEPSSLAFGADDWNAAQAVTVAAVPDSHDNAGDQRRTLISHRVSGPGSGYAGLSVDSLAVTVADDDDPPSGAILSTGTDSVAEGGGATGIEVAAALLGDSRFAEARAVRVTVGRSGDAAEAGSDYAAVDSFEIAIAAGAAGGSATFTLTPKNDAVDEPNEALTISGALAGVTVSDASTTIIDDDVRGVTLSASSLAVAAGQPGGDGGNQASYTIRLDSEPTGTVTIRPESGDASIAAVSPASLSFDASNWGDEQMAVVTGIDGGPWNDGEGKRSTTIVHELSAAGSDYALGVTVPPIDVTVSAAAPADIPGTGHLAHAERWWNHLGKAERTRALFGDGASDRQASRSARPYRRLTDLYRKRVNSLADRLLGPGYGSVAEWWSGTNCRKRNIALGVTNMSTPGSPVCRQAYPGTADGAEALSGARLKRVNSAGMALLGLDEPGG